MEQLITSLPPKHYRRRFNIMLFICVFTWLLLALLQSGIHCLYNSMMVIITRYTSPPQRKRCPNLNDWGLKDCIFHNYAKVPFIFFCLSFLPICLNIYNFAAIHKSENGTGLYLAVHIANLQQQKRIHLIIIFLHSSVTLVIFWCGYVQTQISNQINWYGFTYCVMECARLMCN